MKFKYKKFGRGILRPVIPIEVIHNSQSVFYEVLVDSGADLCIFSSGIAELLDIDLEKGEKKMIEGVTGVPEYYYLHPITLKVGGWDYQIKAGFFSKIAKVGYGVVGQQGFFDKFVIKFDLIKEEIELSNRKA